MNGKGSRTAANVDQRPPSGKIDFTSQYRRGVHAHDKHTHQKAFPFLVAEGDPATVGRSCSYGFSHAGPGVHEVVVVLDHVADIAWRVCGQKLLCSRRILIRIVILYQELHGG